MKKVRAFAPATVANVCCGFDVLGFAVQSPADEVTLTLTDEPGVVITKITGGSGRLPAEPDKNTAGVAVKSFLGAINKVQGVEIELVKKLPLGSGMGSSAASAVAALVGINHLMGSPLSRKALVVHAMEAERVACGTAHADNAAPSLLGGFVLIRDTQSLDFITVPAPSGLFCTLVHPHLEVKTADSRKILKSTVSLRDSLTQSGNLASLILGLATSDYGLISRSLHDVIAEPVRSLFIPGFHDLKAKAKESGALGFGISGSGPTVFALSNSRAIAENVGAVVSAHFKSLQLENDVFVSDINQKGAGIIDEVL